MIEGVTFGDLNEHHDERGSFAEAWRDNRVVQVNISDSDWGVLRGMHYHQHQTDRWVCLSGEADVRLLDLRPLASGRDPVLQYVNQVGDGEWLVIPPGVAHGFLAGPAGFRLLYGVTREYDGSDEWGLAWDDPAVGEWNAGFYRPLASGPILSERDRHNPVLADLRRRGIFERP